MTTQTHDAVLVPTMIEQGVAEMKATVAKETIEKWKGEYMSLTVNGIDDKQGLKLVYDARQVVKKTRIQVEKKAKELKEDALKYQRAVNAAQNEIVTSLVEIEDYLKGQEDKVEQEKERIKKEEAEREEKRLFERSTALVPFGLFYNGSFYKIGDETFSAPELKAMSEERFESLRVKAESAHKAEVLRKEEEERVRKEEQARMERIAAEQEAERKRLEEIARLQKEKEEALLKEAEEREAFARKEREAEEAKLRAERDQLEREKREHEEAKRREEERIRHEADIAKAKEDAALQAKKDAELKAAREAEEKRLRDEREAKRMARKQELAPDRTKIRALIDSINGIHIPNMKDQRAKDLVEQVQSRLTDVVLFIQREEELL